MGERDFRYRVLYIRDGEHQRIKNILEGHMPEGRGEVFYPCMEYYRRDDREVRVKAVFPGYLFLYSDLNLKEMHELVFICRPEIHSGVRELALSERRAFDPEFLSGESTEDRLYDISDVDEEEASFLDYLRKGNGLLSMSSGYEYEAEGGKKRRRGVRTAKRYAVMEGPLKIYEDKIDMVDKHNRRAFLKFEVNGRKAQAGFLCLPKAHWFPEKNSEIATLSDGTEFDIGEMKRRIMAISG